MVQLISLRRLVSSSIDRRWLLWMISCGVVRAVVQLPLLKLSPGAPVQVVAALSISS